MLTPAAFRRLALSFPEATEEAHFDKASFRVRKKIFATWDAAAGRATLKLSAADQDIFHLAARDSISPVPNSWGRQGWTDVTLSTVPAALLRAALAAAYRNVAPKGLAGAAPANDTL
ncbi:MAG: MmcQ/YjbR family DNA-binding protein [Chitinophagaceae bacterium]|nr:MAG: MmcQ/YjbR family DNA-binding protein [Chitinophagaceae bacterium]